jgi:hypothetical protein
MQEWIIKYRNLIAPTLVTIAFLHGSIHMLWLKKHLNVSHRLCYGAFYAVFNLPALLQPITDSF